MKNLYINTFGLTENEFEMVVTGTPKRDYLIKQENITRTAQLSLDENITSLIQSDEYARRLAKAVKLKGGEDWFKDYVEHYKKRTLLKEVEDLSEYFVN
jgi:type IV secretory pathway VirB4 component